MKSSITDPRAPSLELSEDQLDLDVGPLSLRERLLGRIDLASGALILLMVVFGPWAFGTTPPWAITVMNLLGYTLGALLLLKWTLRAEFQLSAFSFQFFPGRARLSQRAVHSAAAADESQRFSVSAFQHFPAASDRRFARALGCLTVLILGYALASAWNARAVYEPDTWSFRYRDAIRWLPHSYDVESSWRAFWMYLGLAGLFWGVRDWLRNPSEPAHEHLHDAQASRLPRRLRLLLWVLSVNGALIALQGIIQRVDASKELLWLVEPRVHKEVISFFGPFAYRANASQYLNLIWPVALGFWWISHQRWLTGLRRGHRGSLRHHILLSCVLLMAIGPIVSTSRGGALVMAGLAIIALGAIGLTQWRGTLGSKALVLGLLTAAVGAALLLGWQELGPRFEGIESSYLQREAIYLTGRRMASEHALFGTGPGTLSPMFQLYRRAQDEYWPAQLHNDWLETQITFGWAGLALLLLAAGVAATRWLARGGIPAPPLFGFLGCCALGGCLVHARFDFPLQIHSILALFLVLCAILSCLGRGVEGEGGR